MKKLLAGFLLSLLSAACGGAPERPPRAPGSVLWVEPASLGRLDAATFDELRAAGVRELFLSGFELEWDGPRARIEAPANLVEGPRAPVSLVISGAWPEGLGDTAEEAARSLRVEFERMRLEAEAAGLLPVGFHLVPSTASSWADVAEVVEALMAGLGEGMGVSLQMEESTLGVEAAERIGRAVDCLVVFLYGQDPGEAEVAARWRFNRVVERTRVLDELRVDYLIGVRTLGAAYRLAADGQRIAWTVNASPGDLVRDPALGRGRDRILHGLDRRAMTIEAERPTDFGSWRLAEGERIRAVQVLPVHLIDLRERLREAALKHHLGEVFYRLPAEGEGMALGAADLAAALSGFAAPMAIEVDTATVSVDGDQWTFRVILRNVGQRSTDIAFFDQNFARVEVEGGVVLSARAGAFRRYQLDKDGEEIRNMRALRTADGLRLYVPVLEPGDEVRSGPVVVRGEGGRPPALLLGGHFLLPGGGELDLDRQPRSAR
ncbi:MAG: hypothetical protein AAF481_16270 [Acidobacteriota bacterium]